MALREILAELDVAVRGLGSVDEANAELDRYLRTLSPAEAKVEGLRVKQMQSAEMASRLARKIREVQKAEGDNAKKLEELRRAYIRAREAANAYGKEADEVRAGATQTSTASTGLIGTLRGAHVAILALTAGAVAAARSLSVFSDAIAEVIHQGAQIDDTSKRLGLNSDALQEWQFIAERSDVEADALTGAFARLARNAAGGSGPFRELGVSVRDSNGELRSQEELFGDSIRALSAVENRTRRAALAQRIFGRSGNELLPLLEDGPQAIDELRRRFQELGGGLSRETVETSAAADDAFVDLDLAMRSFKATLAADIIPIVTRVVDTLSGLVAGARELIETSSIVETLKIAFYALATAAGVLAVATFPLWAPIVAIGVAFLLLLVAVEDVVTAFRGGESVFGSVVEWFLELFGITISFQDALRLVGEWWDATAKKAEDAAAAILRAASRVAGALGLELGTGQTQIGAGGGTALVRSAGGAPKGAGTVNANRVYNINGAQDTQAIAREIDRHERRKLRELADTIALAEEPA